MAWVSKIGGIAVIERCTEDGQPNANGGYIKLTITAPSGPGRIDVILSETGSMALRDQLRALLG